ncbi:MAG: hypothetical protein COW72_01425 [Candidatus Nealsonbacteria bacterium CG18_big_fil_WC_8_21_14_2_50_37_10]|uniref:DUF86 domain-containing protein n=2 Tax=Parcubacteria group TaxID=1794811 RepID=A0A2H0FLZ8_9BACT|nr:MAG: hypothetical protein COW72_01425 [Candidatus Nealsonbacteria bacterium CG18_big_fil_WC_8_21_14_2_50_37_10]
MKNLKINKKIISDRGKLIELYSERLKEMKKLPKGRFALPDNFAVGAYNLRCALEATFDICAHILSRIPGAQVAEYKQMAIEMGRQKIVPMEFAEKNLYKMAGYRNRLTHFYFEVTPKEMYEIIQKRLSDFEVFLKHIKKILK